jgi:hypothetical protein
LRENWSYDVEIYSIDGTKEMNAFRVLVASSNADQRGDLRTAMKFEGYEVAEAVTAILTEPWRGYRFDARGFDPLGRPVSALSVSRE